MKFAVSVITPEIREEAPLALLSGSFDQRLQKAAALGYQGVELLCCHPSLLSPGEIRACLARHGLKPAAVATGFIASYRGLTLVSPDPGIRSRAVSVLKELIVFAAAIGAPVVTIGGFRGKAAFVGSRELALEQLHLALAAADPLALEQGVTLALEPIRPGESDLLNTAEEVCALLDEGRYQAIGLLLDIFHMRLGEQAPMETFRRFAHRLVHVHLADTDRMPLGQGSYDFAPMEAFLRDLPYTGWQSLELPRGSSPDRNAILPPSFRPWLE